MKEMAMKLIIDKLAATGDLPSAEMEALLHMQNKRQLTYLYEKADEVRRAHFGNKVYIRGLVEVSNYCRNNCYYCGIRAGNRKVERYRLSVEQILACAAEGYSLGFRTFVLQGGEDSTFTDDFVCGVVSELKKRYPDCAITLSLGERSYQSYKAMYDAGADRYLLRHETADSKHYQKLHPEGMLLENRKKCLEDLKYIGYQVGAGFMVGSPYQTAAHILADLRFLKRFAPHMVGIGPFIPHKDTPFAAFPAGDLTMTLKLLSIVRLMLPKVLLPATTALGSMHPQGREMGICAGANVVMPNLSPQENRALYALYNNKLSNGAESAQMLEALKENMAKIGYEVVVDRGDALM